MTASGYDMKAIWKSVGLALGVAGTLVACAQVERQPGDKVDFYKPVQARQCDAPGATSENLQLELAALENAGVLVDDASCGHDGRMYPAVCGAPTGEVWLIRIDAGSEEGARAAGFQPVPANASLQTRACR